MGLISMMNSRYLNDDPIGNFNRGAEKMVGKEFYKNSGMADTAYAFDRMMSLMDGQSHGIKDIEDIYPMFCSICKDLDDFAKLWLQNETSSDILYFRDVLELRLTDPDKFMVMQMHCQYNMLWDPASINVTLVDGIPKTIHGDNRIIAKKIIGNRLTNEESGKLSALINKFKADRSQFHYLIEYAYDKGVHADSWKGWEMVHQARQTGWFPNMASMSAGEMKWAINNEMLKPATPKLPKPKDDIIDVDVIEVEESLDQQSLERSFVQAIFDITKVINEDDAPTDETKEEIITETKKPEPVEFVIDMPLLDLYATVSGEEVVKNGGFGKVIDFISAELGTDIDGINQSVNEMFAKVISMDSRIPDADKEIMKAGFDIAKIFNVLGKGIVPKTIGILGPIIDFGMNLFKNKLKSDPESVHQTIVKYLPEHVTVKVDASVETIEGLADFLRNLVDELIILRDSNVIEEQLESIDCIHRLLKGSLSLFNNEKFKKLMDKFMGKCYDVAEQQDLENAKMMDPAVAFPQMPRVSEFVYDDSVPEWMRKVSNLVQEMKKSKGFDGVKPSFIDQAAADAKAAAEIRMMDEPEINPNFMVDPAVSKQYPWVNQIAAIAIKNGCAVNVKPLFTQTSDSNFVINSIRFTTMVNGNVVPTKSFTIDPGYIMDRRVKAFFNCTANGFGWPESCQEAYHVFDKTGKNLRDDIFNAVFTVGIDGIDKRSKKGMMMYNSSTMQLNRVLDYSTLPTGSVRDEDRQALKNSAFKFLRIIKDFNAKNGVNMGRFRVTSFDPNTMTYTVDNRDMIFMGQQLNAPRMTATITIIKENGKYSLDSNGKQEIKFIPQFLDNCFGTEGPMWPDYMDLIVMPTISDEVPAADPDVEPAAENANDGSTVPAIIADAGQEDEGTAPSFTQAE